MKIYFCALAFLGVALGQDAATELKHVIVPLPHANRTASLAALTIERGAEYPSIVKLSGSVEIKTPVCVAAGKKGAVTCDGYTIVRADEAVFHEDTGQIEAHGSVSVTPLQHAAR
jgi:hypothetical protein